MGCPGSVRGSGLISDLQEICVTLTTSAYLPARSRWLRNTCYTTSHAHSASSPACLKTKGTSKMSSFFLSVPVLNLFVFDGGGLAAVFATVLRSTSSVKSKYLHTRHNQCRYMSKETAQMSQFLGWNILIDLRGLESNKPSFWMRQHRKQNVLSSLLLQDCIYSSWQKDN